jgi:Protein of unknown function (DUF2794)
VPEALIALAKTQLRVETFALEMADETIIKFRGGDRPAPRSDDRGKAGARTPEPGDEVMFDRRELNFILSVYGRMVSQGEWRDYAIGMGRDTAVFAVFRHSSEMPLYRIEKQRQRQGTYRVVAAGGHILKRGHDLKQVLRVLEPNRPQLVE